MFNTLRQSFGLSPTKQQQQDIYAPEASSHRSPSKSQQASQSATPRRTLQPSVWGRLQVESRKGKATSTYPITERECTIGRSGDNDVRLCEIGVSRHACRIRFVKPGQAYLEIIGSNKILVNDDEMLPSSDPDYPTVIALASEDVLVILKYRFRFQYEEISESSQEPVYVSLSPASRGRPSLQPLTTPGGQRRKVRMSLVRVADVDTPRKSRSSSSSSHASGRDSMESLRSRSANVQMSVSTRPQQTPSKGGNGHWQVQDSLVHGSPAAEEDDDGLDADDDEAPVVSQEIIVVEDEPEYDAEAPEEADKENNSLPMMPTQSEAPMSASPKKKAKRRSSFLGRAWPFSGSSLGFYPEEREPLSPVEPEQVSEPAAVAAPEDEAEEDAEDDYLAPLGGESPRMPRSLSSPGRLGSSPSFHLSSRRKVSLRTKTLLKSSAALAERLTAQAEAEYEDPSASPSGSPLESPTRASRMLPILSDISSLALQEDEEESPDVVEVEGDDEDEIDKSLGVIEVMPQVKGEDETLGNTEYVGQEAVAEAAEEEEEDAAPLPELATFELPSVRTSAASKRLSMPAFLGRRSFFGLLPKIRSSNEAEDISSKLDRLRMLEAPAVSREVSSAGTDASVATQQSALSTEASEALKAPARDALRYLLSHKKSPSISQAPTFPDPAPAASGLRTLMLGRPDDASLLEQTKKSKRGSLILAPQHPVAAALREERDSSTPDFVFLRQVFRLSSDDIESDNSLKSLRLFFQEWADIIEEDSECSDEDFEALIDLMASPAAQRVLVAAAGSITRLSSALESAGVDHDVREAYMKQAAIVHETPVTPAPRPPARTAGRCSGGLVIEKDGDNIITYRKTRRGCRGGKRRSKSLSPAVEEGGDNIAAFLTAAASAESEAGTQVSHESIHEVIPEAEEENHPADDSEALIAAVRREQQARAQQDIGVLAASSPMASPTRSKRSAPRDKPQYAIGKAATVFGDARGHRRTATATGLESEAAAEPRSVANSPTKGRGKSQSSHKKQAISQHTLDFSVTTAPNSETAAREVSSPSKSRSKQAKMGEASTPESPVKSRGAGSQRATNGTAASSHAAEAEVVDETVQQAEPESTTARRGRKAAQPSSSTATKATRSRRGGKDEAAEDDEAQVAPASEEPSQPRGVSSSPVKSRIIRGAAARAQQDAAQETQSSPVKPTRRGRRDATTAKEASSDVPTAPVAARSGRGKKGPTAIMSEPAQPIEAVAETEPSPPATRTRSGRVLRKKH